MTSWFGFNSSLTLVAALAVSACGHAEKPAVPAAIPVKVRAVAKASSSAPTRYSGSLEPAVKVELAFRVGGYVERLAEVVTPSGKRPLDKGDFVKKGTVIARVRASDYAQQVAMASAQLSEARSQSRLANEELDRAIKLYQSSAITKAELDSRTAHAEAARASVEAAVARSGEASISLGDTVLRAPMDGVVLARSAEVGTLVAPGQRVLALADTSSMKAVFGAPQSLVERLAVGDPLQVFVGAESEAKSPEKLLDARVTRIAPAADSSGRVFSVEAALPNPDGALRPGTVVSVRVRSLDPADTVVVPLGAIVRSPRDARGFAVFVVDTRSGAETARLADVRLGEVVGNNVTVTDGLALNERVVTVGATLLRDGNRAVVIP
jgi:RND family efflux transporter MFP subunit